MVWPMADCLYASSGEAVGFVRGRHAHALDGRSVGQLRGGHVHRLRPPSNADTSLSTNTGGSAKPSPAATTRQFSS